MKTVYSLDGECFCFGSLFEVAEVALSGAKERELRTIWQGEEGPFKASDLLPRSVVGYLDDSKDDNLETLFCNLTNEQENDLFVELSVTIDKWAEKNSLSPTGNKVKNVRKVTITKRDGEIFRIVAPEWEGKNAFGRAPGYLEQIQPRTAEF